MAKTGKKKSRSDDWVPTKKLLKKEKRKLRAEADAVRFQRTDADSWGDGTKRVLPEDKSTQAAVSASSVSSNIHNTPSSNPEASDVEKVRGAKTARMNNASSPSATLAENASTLLSIAAGIGVLMGFAMFGLPGGKEAVPTIGGVLYSVVPIETARVVFALDTVFPIFYGAGLAVLVTAFQSRGNRPLVRLILTSLLVAVAADFAENALAFGVMAGEPVSQFQFPLTVIKFASIAFAAVMLSSIAPRDGALGMIVHVLLRYVFPVLIALLVSGIGGDLARQIVGASFPVSLLLLSLYAASVAEQMLPQR